MPMPSPCRVALVTCLELPEVDDDQAPLLAALHNAGLSAQVLAWETAAPADADLWILRSPWNYHLHHTQFLSWLDSVAAAGQLCNPASIVRWNSDKAYLVELAEQGLPVAPTVLLPQGSAPDVHALVTARGWTRWVLKPSISLGSFMTERFTLDQVLQAQEFADTALAGRAMLLQPYLSAVEDYGERSLVCIGGQVCHAVRKSPRFSGGHEAVTPVAIADDERALAERVLQTVAKLPCAPPIPLLYARVDTVRGEDGKPLLMELELVEPSLFLLAHPASLQRLVQEVALRAQRWSGRPVR